MSTESGGTATGNLLINTHFAPYNEKVFFLSTTPVGTDYNDTTVTLTFDAIISTQMVTVPILDDNVVEDTEFINLALTSVDNGVIINPPTTRINIEDVDRELRHCHYYIPPSMYLHRTSKVKFRMSCQTSIA